jgi:hypothetical protein
LSFPRFRFRFLDLLVNRWRDPGERYTSLPVPVFLNFLAADLRVLPDFAMTEIRLGVIVPDSGQGRGVIRRTSPAVQCFSA